MLGHISTESQFLLQTKIGKDFFVYLQKCQHTGLLRGTDIMCDEQKSVFDRRSRRLPCVCLQEICENVSGSLEIVSLTCSFFKSLCTKEGHINLFIINR